MSLAVGRVPREMEQSRIQGPEMKKMRMKMEEEGKELEKMEQQGDNLRKKRNLLNARLNVFLFMSFLNFPFISHLHLLSSS